MAESSRKLTGLAVVFGLGATGALLLVLSQSFQPQLLAWVDRDPLNRLRFVSLSIGVMTAGPLLAVAWRIWRTTGSAARRARWRLLILVPLVVAAVFIGILWRFTAFMESAIARAERLVLIGTYTGGTTGSEGIYAFHFEDATGILTPRGLAAATPSPSFLAVSADRWFVFAVNELDTYQGAPGGSVTSFAVDAGASRLTAISTQPSRGAHPCHLELDRSGRFLAVANYTGGNYAVLPVDAEGRLGPPVSVVAGEGRGPTSRQQGPHGHAVTFHRANRYLIATDLGIDRVLVYRFDERTGALSPHQPPSVSLAPGAGPRHFAFHPDGRRAFVINELDSTITSLSWDDSSGAFSVLGSVSTLPAGFTAPSTTAEIQVHPSGRFVYGSNRGHDSIAVFRVAPTGSLELVEIEPTRGRTPRNFTIDPAGRWLLAANQESHTIAVFAIDQATGALTSAHAPVASPTPVSILFVN
jgi:6-phosphogluconolactonase